MLELKNVYKTFNPGTVNAKTALEDLSLTLNEGDFVTVIGGNGAGKSTMLNAVAGAFSVDAGTITIDGQNVTGLPEYKRAAFIGRVFQDPMMGTAATMQIEENLALAARRGQRRGLRWGIKRMEREDYRELLNYVILQEHAEQAARAETAPSGQPVYYYEKEQYETWYHSYAANIPAEIFELSVETVDGAEYVPVPEMGWGNVRAFAIQSVESEGDQYTVGICETNSENDTSKRLTMTVRLSPDGFQYLSVTPPSAGD